MSQSLVTKTIIGLNVLVFAAMVIVSGGKAFLVPPISMVLNWGADYGPYTIGQGEYWRVLTSMFLHFGFIHIALNMWVFSGAGQAAESIFGGRRYLALYLLSGIGGSITSLLFHPGVISAGASGAIFGVVGALAALCVFRKDILDAVGLSQGAILNFIVLNLVIGAMIPGIDLSAHIGGLISGFVLGACLAPARQAIQ